MSRRDPLSRPEYAAVESTFVLPDADGIPLHEITVRYPEGRASRVDPLGDGAGVEVIVRPAAIPIVDFGAIPSRPRRTKR